MAASERPLMVELHWNEDDREGKFVLRDESRNTRPRASAKVCPHPHPTSYFLPAHQTSPEALHCRNATPNSTASRVARIVQLELFVVLCSALFSYLTKRLLYPYLCTPYLYTNTNKST